MSIAPITVLRPTSLAELQALLREYGDEAQLYAGATELVVAMKLGLTDAELLIDLKGVAELADVMIDDDRVRIGATATHRWLERDPELGSVLPVLGEVERRVANARVRAIGTIGGNLVFGEPHSDPSTFLVAAQARYLLAGSDGSERAVAAQEFLRGPFEADVMPGEVLTEIEVPRVPNRVYAYQRFVMTERPAANVAVRLDVSDGQVTAAAVVVGAATPLPAELPAGGDLLRGADLRPDPALVESVGAATAETIELEYGADPDHLRRLVAALTERALTQAFSRAALLPADSPTSPARRGRRWAASLAATAERWREPRWRGGSRR